MRPSQNRVCPCHSERSEESWLGLNPAESDESTAKSFKQGCHSERSEARFLSARFLRDESLWHLLWGERRSPDRHPLRREGTAGAGHCPDGRKFTAGPCGVRR